ncbi:disease resistance protein rga3 [Hordeum vulgare]|nr:disease resistance protein rga3 [Hordeum vulgare]
MQVMIDRAEWSIHKEGVPILLQELKDVSYDTEDLIEEFKYFKLKSEMDGPQSLLKRSLDFIKNDILSSFDKVKLLQQRAEHLMSQMNDLDLQQETPHFDRSARPETSSFPDSKVFGRQKEIVALKVLLGVPVPIPSGSKRKKGPPAAAEATAQKDCMDYPVNGDVSVLAIVGIGGVGKTTLAQQICQDQHVKGYFDQILWTCVSDDFDTKRITKELVHSCGEDIASDNLDYLQNKLAKVVGLNRFLVVLDDVWDDSLKDNGQEWQKFCAPLTTGVQGSMILMTTRSSKVAKLVCTLSPFQLQGLEEDTFWEFFKACALDGKRSTMDIKLASIGRMIVPKLKGSPLAAKTLGRLLRMKIDTVHWSNILNSELWELKQEVGDILPALTLSYLYLPRHLRRCLALCAMFPKDHKFKQTVLVDLWSAQCFVEQDKMCMHTAGDWCFEELESRCFFQEVVASSASAVSSRNKKYVMHDLIHDMIQLVSGNECFVIRNETDLSNVPEKVRHISLFTSKGFDHQKLLALTRCKKLRSILSMEQLGKRKIFPLVNSWSRELKYLRFLSCCFTKLTMLPEAIPNFKLLCCFKVHCPRRWTMDSFPESYCSLYNLQKFEAKNCTFGSLPTEFRKLVNLQSFEVKKFVHGRNCTKFWGISVDVLKNMHLQGVLYLNLSDVRLAGCAELELSKRKHIQVLTLDFYHTMKTQDEEQEMLEAFCPHQDIKFLELRGFKGESTPTWFRPSHFEEFSATSVDVCSYS